MRSLLLGIILLISLLLLYAFEFRNIDRRRCDYAAFYSGAILWNQGRAPYDLAAAREVQTQVGVPLFMPFFHPPLLLPILSATVDSDYNASYLRWVTILLVVIALCVVPLYFLTGSWLDSLLYLTFIPVFGGILQGQDTAFVLLGILVGAILLFRGKDSWAGAAVALSTLRPHWAIVLGIGLLVSRPKAFKAFFITGAILVLYSWLLVGSEGFREIINNTFLMGQSIDANTKHTWMYNLVGIFARLGISPFFAWPFLLAAVVIVAVMWRRLGITRHTFGIAIILMLFFSPQLNHHDLALLVITLLVWPAVIAPILSISLFVNPYGDQLPIYILMLALLCSLISKINLLPDRDPVFCS
jgi:hypothetical protein